MCLFNFEKRHRCLGDSYEVCINRGKVEINLEGEVKLQESP